MGGADRHAVDEIVAVVGVDRRPHGTVAGDVDEAGGAAVQGPDRVVGDGAAVDPQALDELGVAGRGQPDRLDLRALRQQESGGDRGLAGGAGDDDRPAPGQSLVGELIVDQERGEEERPQQHLHRLGLGPVEEVGVAGEEAVIGGGQRRPVWRAVGKAAGANCRWRDEQVG